MAEKPLVEPGRWVRVSNNVNAVVCAMHEDGSIEVVYLDQRKRAVNEDAEWTGEEWGFTVEGPDGGYADGYSRLQEYVSILRSGRKH